jgi:putative membrane protein
MDRFDQVLGWQRLDRRMLLVHPVRELGRYFVPLLLVVLFRRGSSGGGRWELLFLAIPIGLGILRYLTTSYRLTTGRVEVRRGLLNKRVVSTPLDRVRTVDVTASPIHRALGVVSLHVGTGHTTDKGEGRLVLDGLSVSTARELRATLLHTVDNVVTVDAAADTDDSGEVRPAPRSDRRTVLTLDLRWVRFAPLTTAGVVIAGAALGLFFQSLRTFQLQPRVDLDQVERLGLTLLVIGGLLSVLLVLTVLAVVGYVVTNFGFQLTQTRDGGWHLRRGLFTTRETSLDESRVSGVSIGEPLSLRLARGARLSAIVTGLARKQQVSSVLVPPAPRTEVDRVAAEVLGSPGPVVAPLVAHGARAVRRRWTRALVPAAVVAVAGAVASYAWSPVWLVVPVLALALGVLLSSDRSRGLGHALVEGHLVARSGSLNRRREALATPSVIGWNLRATWFQRRVGLTDLVATTAGGRQSVRVIDLAQDVAVDLAHTAQPGLLDPFLEVSSARTADTGP